MLCTDFEQGTGVDDFLFSGDDIEATVDRLRQRDARRAKGKKAKAIKEVEAVKEVKQSKVREQVSLNTVPRV